MGGVVGVEDQVDDEGTVRASARAASRTVTICGDQEIEPLHVERRANSFDESG